eukprot:3449624-Rhodomonas_salina.2
MSSRTLDSSSLTYSRPIRAFSTATSTPYQQTVAACYSSSSSCTNLQYQHAASGSALQQPELTLTHSSPSF